MIKELHLHQIGPVPDLEAEFGPRLNLVTGDNGLGKTFLLDACWYALTRTWADNKQFYPSSDVPKNDPPSIKYTVIGKAGKPSAIEANYRFLDQKWKGPQARPSMPGLVIYARIDGGFSVWDPARNYWREDESEEGRERPKAYQFTKDQVWDGLEDAEGKEKRIICNGLLRDVEGWRAKGNGAFGLLEGVLEQLSEGENEILSIGAGVRVRLNDVRDIPTLRMPYGPVPVTQAAAGMRRVLALAYLLVWAWEEHTRAAKLQKDEPTNRIVLLFDEMEAHLHPKWQRVFLPSLMKVVDGLLVKGQIEATTNDPRKSLDQKASSALKKIPRSVQIIATTHAPLILASVETYFDDVSDKVFLFELQGSSVKFKSIDWSIRGDVSAWLRSPLFSLDQARSTEAEEALEVAEKWMRRDRQKLPPHLDSEAKIHHRLLEVLPEFDPFWPRWIVKREGHQ